MPILSLPLPPDPPAAVPALPQITVKAGFGANGGPVTWTDISAYVRSGTISRPATRLAGPLYQYQAGTASIVLKNPDGRFDPDDLSGPYTSSTGLQAVVTTLRTTGGGTWVAPQNMVGNDIKVECWGGGGGGHGPATVAAGDGGGAGGGGEYAAELHLPVTPGASYAFTVGAGGAGGSAGNGQNGGTTSFSGDAAAVTAHGGTGGLGGGVGGPGGSGSVNLVHFNGGHGGSNTSFGVPGHNGGGGGGGSGCPTAAGLAGSNTSSDSGALGAPAQPDGGPGGNGGGLHGNGHAPVSGPGGGGGGGWANPWGASDGGNGYRGKIRLTYTVTVPAAVTSQVLPMVPIQVQATWNSITYSLFTGYATSWADAGLNNPRYAEVTVSATDGLYVLAGVVLPQTGTPVGAGETTGDRVTRILYAAGWPDEQILADDGDSALQATTFGDSALNLIQVAVDTEVGEFYIDGAGNAVFRRRSAILSDPRSTTAQLTLGDRPGTVETTGTEQPYTVTIEVTDDAALFNDIQNTRVGGTLQEAIDLASVSQFLFPRSYARSDLLNISDADALDWARYVLRVAVQIEDRFDTVTLSPRRDPADLWPQALGRELGDRIQMWRRPPGVAAFSKPCFIRGIEHTWDFSTRTWETMWTLQNASRFSFLILDDPVQGRLDFNALSY